MGDSVVRSLLRLVRYDLFEGQLGRICWDFTHMSGRAQKKLAAMDASRK